MFKSQNQCDIAIRALGKFIESERAWIAAISPENTADQKDVDAVAKDIETAIELQRQVEKFLNGCTDSEKKMLGLHKRIVNDAITQQLAGALNIDQLATNFLEYRAQARDVGLHSQKDILSFVIDALQTKAGIDGELDHFEASKAVCFTLFERMSQIVDATQNQPLPDSDERLNRV